MIIQNWYLSFLDSPEERLDFISEILAEFLDDVVCDISDMTAQQSGWNFCQVLRFDVRHVVSSPHNLVRYGGRYRNRKDYHPYLSRFFFRNVLDPGFYLKKGLDTLNLCIPTCVLMSLHARLGVGLRRISMRQFKKDLKKYFIFENLFNLHGLSLEQMNTFEENFIPVPSNLVELFPALAFFKGLSINFFRIRKNGQKFFIFPFALSPNSRDHSFFQIDVLIETDDIFSEDREIPSSTEYSPFHCLLIMSLRNLTNKIKSEMRTCHNACHNDNFQYICRTCFKLFKDRGGIEQHELSCKHQKRGKGGGRRKCNNTLIHKPLILNKFTGKTQLNGLTFKKSKLYTVLKPLSLAFLDFESYNTPVSDSSSPKSCVYEGVPNTAIFLQSPLSYCYLLRSLYHDQHPLPECLKAVRLRCCEQQTDVAIKDFFIALLLDIRRDLESHGQFLAEVIASDPGVPSMQRLTMKDRIHFLSAKFCQICGKRFGSHYFHPRTKKKIIILKCKDHDHFLRY